MLALSLAKTAHIEREKKRIRENEKLVGISMKIIHFGFGLAYVYLYMYFYIYWCIIIYITIKGNNKLKRKRKEGEISFFIITIHIHIYIQICWKIVCGIFVIKYNLLILQNANKMHLILKLRFNFKLYLNSCFFFSFFCQGE